MLQRAQDTGINGDIPPAFILAHEEEEKEDNEYIPRASGVQAGIGGLFHWSVLIKKKKKMLGWNKEAGRDRVILADNVLFLGFE